MNVTQIFRRTDYLGFTFLVLASSYLFGCGGRAVEKERHVTVTIDSIVVKSDSLLATSFNSTALFATDSVDYLFLSDPFQRIISVLDVKKNQFLFNIRLQREGPHGVQNLGWIECLGKDSILAITSDYSYLINWRGKVIKRDDLNPRNKSSSFDFSKHRLLTTSNNSVLKNNSKVIFAKLRSRVAPSVDAFYEDSMLGSYSFSTGEITDLPIFFPAKFRHSNANYDLNTYPEVSVNGRLVYYIYPFSSSVFCYDGKQASEVYQDDQQILEPIDNKYSNDFFKKGTYMVTYPAYRYLSFDNKNKLVYQIYNLKKEKFEDPTEFIILVRDSVFNIVGKIKPCKDLFPARIAYDGRLLFRKHDAEIRDGGICLVRYEFGIR